MYTTSTRLLIIYRQNSSQRRKKIKIKQFTTFLIKTQQKLYPASSSCPVSLINTDVKNNFESLHTRIEQGNYSINLSLALIGLFTTLTFKWKILPQMHHLSAPDDNHKLLDEITQLAKDKIIS